MPRRSAWYRSQLPAIATPLRMATVRRLSDEDVRGIFECLHHGTAPPHHLQFQIVPVGAKGLKLSPPSYEFDDGLYVLLRPEKRRRTAFDPPRVPEHLEHLVMEDVPEETCPWSLSGPQFPHPTAIQQRYCYPKGRPEYSSRKGGALWTMYGTDGKEDLDFRLLHVYFSAKRAVNQGMNVTEEEMASLQSTPNKRVKTITSPNRFVTTPLLTLQTPKAIVFKPKLSYTNSNASTASSSSSKSPPPIARSLTTSRDSPIDFDMLPMPPPPPSPCFSGSNGETKFVSPMSDIFVRRDDEDDEDDDDGHGPQFLCKQEDVDDEPLGTVSAAMDANEPSPFDIDTSLRDIDYYYWNDPLLSITTQLSTEDNHDDESRANDDNASGSNQNGSVSAMLLALESRLESIHDTIRRRILTSPLAQQGALINAYSTWARHVANEPLGPAMLDNSIDGDDANGGATSSVAADLVASSSTDMTIMTIKTTAV